MTRRRCFPALLLVLAIARAAPAQSLDGTVDDGYLVQRWDVDDGLPVRHVTAAVQEPGGYLWLTTSDGLVRFDGLRFTAFDAANSPDLPTNRFSNATRAPDGSIWLLTEDERVLRYADGTFEDVAAAADLAPSKAAVFVAGDSVLVPTEQGLWAWKDGQMRPVRPRAIQGSVRGLLATRDGALWVATLDRIVRIGAEGRPRTVADAPAIVDRFLIPPPLYEDPSGRIWLASSEGAFRFDGRRFVRVEGTTQPVRRIGRGTGDATWVLANGTWLAYRDGRLVSERAPVYGDPLWPLATADDGATWWIEDYWLYRDAVRVLELDPQVGYNLTPDGRGGMWVVGDALARVHPRPVQTISEPEGLPARLVYPVLHARDGSMWVGMWGTQQGLVQLRDGQVVQTFKASLVSALHETRDGTIWVGRFSGLSRLREGRVEGVTVPEAAPLGLTGNIHVIHEDQRGRLWIGSAKGLLIGLPGDERRWKPFPLSHAALAVVETASGEILIGSRGAGLGRHLGGGRFEWLGSADGLASDNVRDVHEDERGVLWIATEDRGLCRLDRRGARTLLGADLACLGTEEGLYDLSLHRVLPDDDGRLWLSSNRGLFWLDRAQADAVAAGTASTLSSVAYTERDGMRSREANGARQPAGGRGADGRLYFPTQDGLAVIDPASVRRPVSPPVRIEGLTLGETEVDGPTLASGRVEMAPGVRDLTLRYAGIAFGAPESVRYRVRLEGYDDEWRPASDQREATYTNLPPGTYTLRVQAGVGGQWGQEAALAVVRAPQVWETTWFAVLAALLAIGLLASGVRLWFRRLRHRQAELETTVAERTAALRDANARLSHANASKSRFLANVSHELRTPLALLLGPIRDLHEGRFGVDETARPLLDRAAANGQRLRRLIDDLLALARLDAEAVTLRREHADLGRFVRERVSAFGSQAEALGIVLEAETPEAPLGISFDPAQVETVVYNVVGNALKFTPRGGHVDVRVRAAESGAEVAVTDTGVGIEPGDLAHLFDRFYQADTTASRAGEGAGIGLALAHEIVELHGGRITAESTPGEGTTIRVWLPSGEPDESTATPPEALRPPPELPASLGDGQPGPAPGLAEAPDEERPLVLVVEDNADLRAYLRAILGTAYRVEEAADGAGGLSAAIDLVPDLVLSDVMMPGVDGFALLSALKADVRTSHIPVVLLTARADAESRLAGLGAGADDYLAKPFSASEVEARVANLIAGRRALRERWSREATLSPTAEPPLSREAAFLDAVRQSAEAGMGAVSFGAMDLADAMAMSPRQFRRKLKALTDETPSAYLRRLRLARAAHLLRAGHTVGEAADAVGFASRSQFGAAFREAYGRPPSAFAEDAREDI